MDYSILTAAILVVVLALQCRNLWRDREHRQDHRALKDKIADALLIVENSYAVTVGVVDEPSREKADRTGTPPSGTAQRKEAERGYSG